MATTLQVQERNKVAQRHSKLVHAVVHRFVKKCNEPYEDLYQVGFIGLLKAAERFQPELKNAFSSFAIPKIEGEIQHYLRDCVPTLKVPRHALEKYAQVKRLRKHFISLGRQIDEAQVAQKIGISAKQWQVIQQLNQCPSKLSWDELVYEPLQTNSDNEDENTVYEAIAQLNSRERYCVVQRYLIGRNIDDIANQLKTNVLAVEAILVQAIYLMNLFLSANYNYDSHN